MTTNGSGLFDMRGGRAVIDWLVETGVAHLNISRAHPDPEMNAKLMALPDGISVSQLREAVARCESRRHPAAAVVRAAQEMRSATLTASCATSISPRDVGVDSVIFRQLMQTDPATVEPNFVVRFSDAKRVMLEGILDRIGDDARFEFQRQIVGYYYYVEVWRSSGVDIVFEEADLAQLERTRRADSKPIHELVFHPNATLASTWQPWDGVLG